MTYSIVTEQEYLTYDDVLIKPAFSDIYSREEISVFTSFLGRPYFPIMNAPMDTVASPELVSAISNMGAFGVLHRFGTPEELMDQYGATTIMAERPFSLTIGARDWDTTRQMLDSLSNLGYDIDTITIDVAHGHHENVGVTIENVKDWSAQRGLFSNIIAGNVATVEGFDFLSEYQVDAVRVGIGPGSACTTRETTGIGVPQFSALMEIVNFRNRHHPEVGIIADGGIQHPGDIAKALAVGADMVMIGRLLAGADEAPQPGLYRGQSTVGTNGLRNAPEGTSGPVESTGPVKDTVNQLLTYLKSSMSYVGARNLAEFKENVEFVRVSPNVHRESMARI